MRKKNITALLLTALMILMTGCAGTQAVSDTKDMPATLSETRTEQTSTESETIQAVSMSEFEIKTSNMLGFDVSSVSEYNGTAYIMINDNMPFFTDDDITDEAFETYSDLDSLGRCGPAYANICLELMPTEERGEIGSVKPSGWHTIKYNDLIDGNYLYNRCHLIGYQLAGENANEKNLITGTRYLNVTGMLPFENQVADYVESTGNHVLYRVTPIFVDDELVCRGVLIEAESVEDDGCVFCVFCYNVQPYITIDYATGDSWETETGQKEQNQTSTSDASDDKQQTYVLNTNSLKIHRPDCDAVSKMNENNKQSYTGSISDIISQGYSKCGICNPD
jgi:DNA-entry nuclease